MESPTWSVPPTTKLKWRRWGDEIVVFNPSSGDTHYLNAIAGAVLEQLAIAPGTFEEIVGNIEAIGDAPLDSDATAEIRALIERFHAVGLIELVRA